MRQRIKQLGRGKFEYDKPELTISEERVEFTVAEDSTYEGSFIIQCRNQKKIRGIVYSTNPRMECLTPQFEGEEVRIRYEFNSKGLSEGLNEKGDFVIVCNQNEIGLSFCATISRLYTDSSIGTIRNITDFVSLAKANWEEAYQLFYHKNFVNIIRPDEEKESMFYKGMMGVRPSNRNVEEFLIGIGKKEKISFSVDKEKIELYDVSESVKETIEIRKSHWGFVEIHAVCEESFVRIEKTNITSEDFIGSVYPFDFFIDAKQMHGGNNYGKIYLTTDYETIEIEISATCSSGEKSDEKTLPVLQKKEYLVGIMELYQAYRLKRLVKGVWANETIEILNHLCALEPEESLYSLMKAQCLIINRQRQEAEWILNEFKREWVDRKDPVWGYYLYILTLIEREPSYVNRLTKEIELIFHENPDSVLLFWVLTFLQEKYIQNSELKFKAIEYWVMKGCASPYLYLEAYHLIWQDPYLLTKLDAFEVRVLRWAIKNSAITKDISMQIFHVVENSRGFDPVYYELLCAAYEADPKPENLGIICGYLIKGQKFDKKYHHWYVKGIELELRITGLYEAYLMSMDERQIVPVPKIIQMYFQYESGLPYKKLAVLYNNIIASKNTNKEIYLQYRKTMGRFAMEQVEKGHMDDNLAVLYEDMLDLGLINQDIARALAKIVFIRKMVVFDSRFVRVIIYHKQCKAPQVVPIVEQTAYFNIYTEDYVILFEDYLGRRYAGSVSYHIQNLMDPEKYLEKCMSFAPEQLSYLIYYLDKKMNYLAFTSEDKEYLKTVMFSPEVSREYKAKLLPEILRFYQMNTYEEIIETYLKMAEEQSLDSSTRKYVFELMVEYHLFDYAYEKITDYGMDQIGSAAKVALASYMIDRCQEEEDDFLVELSAQAFFKKKYNDKILSYLSKYYSGPTEQMLSLWNAAKAFEIERFDLAERLLVQMMYADTLVIEGEDVFAYYYEKGGKDFITLAYLSDSAHKYFVDEKKIHEDIFRVIEARMLYNLELNDACKLALLRYYSQLEYLGKRQLALEDELLAEYTRRSMHFAFFKELHPDLVLKYHLYDKVFLEYSAHPSSHVVLNYSRDEDGENFIKEDMPDVYDGIFVKAFVMFFGETIQYYISEEYAGQVRVSESNRIINNDVYKDDVSRYNLLNQMLISNSLKEEEEMLRSMKQYAGYNEVTKKGFRVL